MKGGRERDVVVGTFVLVVVGLLVAWVAMITGRTGPTDTYHAYFERVPGLKVGGQVLFQGYPMGFVDAIDFDPAEGVFEVDLALQRDWPVPEDSVALIKASGLLASVVVDIQSGRSDRRLAPGGTVASEEPADMLAALTTAARQLGSLMEEDIRPLLASLRSDVPEITSSVQRVVDATNVTVERVNNLLRDENAGRVDRILLHTEDASARVARLMSDVQETQRELHDATVALNHILQSRQGDVDRSIVDLQQTLQTVSLRIDAITTNLEATSRDMAAFSNQIRRDPSLVLRGRDRPDDPPEAR